MSEKKSRNVYVHLLFSEFLFTLNGNEPRFIAIKHKTQIYKLKVSHPDRFARNLRLEQPPVVLRIQDDSICIDPRTLLEGECEEVIACLQRELSLQ